MEKGFRIIKNVLTNEEVKHANRLMSSGDLSAHSELLWYVRTRKGVMDVYRSIYSENDLSTSFDGASWKKPGEESWTLFWHVDHDARHPPNFRVYQSTVALSTIDDSSGGIQFASG